VVSVTDPYGRILGFLDRSRYFSIKKLLSCTHEAEWTPFQTHYFFFWQCRESNPDLRICSQELLPLDHRGGRIQEYKCEYKKYIFIRNYDTTVNKNRSSPITLMIPESNRRIKMNKLLINNNNTKTPIVLKSYLLPTSRMKYTSTSPHVFIA
jgi:hypothetical protein